MQEVISFLGLITRDLFHGGALRVYWVISEGFTVRGYP